MGRALKEFIGKIKKMVRESFIGPMETLILASSDTINDKARES